MGARTMKADARIGGRIAGGPEFGTAARRRLRPAAAERWIGLVLMLAAGVGRPAAAAGEVGGPLAVEGGLSWGYDSNVLEAVNRDRWAGDSFARVEVGLARPAAGHRTWGWSGQARLAAEEYVNYRSQDRSLILGSLGVRRQRGRVMGELRWTGQRVDRPHADSLSLVRQTLAHAGGAALGDRTRLDWLADGTWVCTEPGGPSQRRSWRLGGDLERAVAGPLRAVIRFEVGEARYDEPAIASWEGGENVFSARDQRDRQLLWGAGLDWSAATLVRLAYGYRAIDSNSLGYAQDRHEASVSVARLLPARISLQLVGLWQEPCYRDEGFAKWRLRDDPEDLDIGARSGVTLRLRRPLGAGFSADAQTGWERNEARVTGRFYERIQVLLAIRYQVGN